MTTLISKRDVLKKAGFIYDFDREVYFNRKQKKAFSVEFIEDHDAREIERRIGEKTSAGKWRFYFNTPPSDAVERELERVLS